MEEQGKPKYRLICARLGDPQTEYREEHLPVVRRCSSCGAAVLATRPGIDKVQTASGGFFAYVCLECHAADRSEKLLYDSDGRFLGHTPARKPEDQTDA